MVKKLKKLKIHKQYPNVISNLYISAFPLLSEMSPSCPVRFEQYVTVLAHPCFPSPFWGQL